MINYYNKCNKELDSFSYAFFFSCVGLLFQVIGNKLLSIHLRFKEDNSCIGTRGGSKQHAGNQWQPATLCKLRWVWSYWLDEHPNVNHSNSAGARKGAGIESKATSVRVPILACACLLHFCHWQARAMTARWLLSVNLCFLEPPASVPSCIGYERDYSLLGYLKKK